MNVVRHHDVGVQIVATKNAGAVLNCAGNYGGDFGDAEIRRTAGARVEQAIHSEESLTGGEAGWRKNAAAWETPGKAEGDEHRVFGGIPVGQAALVTAHVGWCGEKLGNLRFLWLRPPSGGIRRLKAGGRQDCLPHGWAMTGRFRRLKAGGRQDCLPHGWAMTGRFRRLKAGGRQDCLPHGWAMTGRFRRLKAGGRQDCLPHGWGMTGRIRRLKAGGRQDCLPHGWAMTGRFRRLKAGGRQDCLPHGWAMTGRIRRLKAGGRQDCLPHGWAVDGADSPAKSRRQARLPAPRVTHVRLRRLKAGGHGVAL